MFGYFWRSAGLCAVCAAFAVPIDAVAAVAVPAAQLKLSGKILPTTCELVLPESNTIDYGGISSSDLMEDSVTFIGVKYLKYNISCETGARIAVKFDDGRKGTASEEESITPLDQRYGLGLASGKAVGFYSLPGTNKSKMNTCISQDNAASWSSGEAGVYAPGTMMSWGADYCSRGPTALNEIEIEGSLQVLAYIASRSSLPVGDKIELDGMFVMELVYL